MNQQEAKNYILEIAHIWMHGQNDQLEKYYAQNFEGNYYGNLIKFPDLVQRLNYMNLHQSQRNIDLKDIIVDNSKIVIRFHYTAIDDIEGEIDTDTIAIYHLGNDNKIINAWAYADKTLKYTRD